VPKGDFSSWFIHFKSIILSLLCASYFCLQKSPRIKARTFMFPEEINQKLRKIIQAKNPNLSEDEADKLTSRFSELGFFLVRLWLKHYSKHAKPSFTQDFDQNSGRAPPQ